jgi:uncharacterized protein YndB with AHSA1/START domain
MTAKPSDHANDGTTLELPSEREILITRTFHAPASIVFEAVTKPEHVRRWWAPKTRGEMLTCEVDFRVGGKWRYTMRANRGFEVGFSGSFLEIEAPTKVVQTEIFDPFPDAVSTVTMQLREAGSDTTLTVRSLYPSREVRDQVIASGMEDGMRESYRQLADVVGSLT